MVTKKKKKSVSKKVPAKKKKAATKKKTPVKKKGKRGGKRVGAGRKHGSKGRPPGAVSQAAQGVFKKTRKVADKIIAEGGQTPLEFLLAVMWETPEEIISQYKAKELSPEECIVKLEGLQRRRYEAAKDAAPYMHPKLASVEQKQGGVHEDWLDRMDRLEEEAGL